MKNQTLITLEKSFWSLSVSVAEDGVSFAGGRFGELSVLPSPVFHLKLEDRAGNEVTLDSATGWNRVRYIHDDSSVKFWLTNPGQYGDVTVVVTGRADEKGLSWYTDVINESDSYSVTEMTYPTPVMRGDTLHLFIPDCCGRVIRHAGKNGFDGYYMYPGHNMSMQYFAWWGETSGIYLGVHDPDACMKAFTIHAGEDRGRLQIDFPAIGAGQTANSFSLGGCLRWEAITGDWYDATMLYAAFVHTSAKWLPVKGRPDTPARFKEIPYWICDYIPNSEKQMEARPMTLASVSERYGKDYWVDAAIALKKRLGTPVAYHVYNWHEIPFNINYPHFTPARETAKQGFERLKEAGLYIFPYINAVSWEMDDADEGFAESFSGTGIHGAVLDKNGNPLYVPYPQKKANGQDTRLAPICPSFLRWHQIMEDVTREMEASLPIDGIYFDQVSAVPPTPCRNSEHTHLPGGGSYWSDGYNRMMEKISAAKPADKFYFSESNAEAYAKSFDGFLTWVWTMGDDVPAFPAVYAGYIQMLGRYTDGAKRDDDVYFRYHLAEALLFGQQLGWLNAHVIYNEERMRFLEKLVHTRYAYTKLFNEGKLLRPPYVETAVQPVTSSGITMRLVLAGVWQMDDRSTYDRSTDDLSTNDRSKEDRSKVVLIVINISDKPAEALLHLYPDEYGVHCPSAYPVSLEPMSVKVVEYGRLL